MSRSFPRRPHDKDPRRRRSEWRNHRSLSAADRCHQGTRQGRLSARAALVGCIPRPVHSSTGRFAVLLSEVAAKLQTRGVPGDFIDQSVAYLDLQVVPFNRNQAMRAGNLRTLTRGAGLSLGDRACLATAAALPSLRTQLGPSFRSMSKMSWHAADHFPARRATSRQVSAR